MQMHNLKMVGIVTIIIVGIAIGFAYFYMYGDFDGDGLKNYQERSLGTNILSKDTDNDYLNDNEEVLTYNTDPLDADTDNDLLYDGEEIQFKTDPFNPDTDGDGYKDGVDLFKTFDAKLKISIIYWKELVNAESLIDRQFYDEILSGDVYFVIRIYINGTNIETIETSPCFNLCEEVEDLISISVNIPDNAKNIKIVIEAWDYDAETTDDQYDISEQLFENKLIINYDLTSGTKMIISDGRADGGSGELDGLIKIKLEIVS